MADLRHIPFSFLVEGRGRNVAIRISWCTFSSHSISGPSEVHLETRLRPIRNTENCFLNCYILP